MAKNYRVIIFLVILALIIGLVVGYSTKKPVVITKTQYDKQTITIKDTVIKVKIDTIKIYVDRIKYFTKYDTILVKNSTPIVNQTNCLTFPLVLSDSSTISVTECSKEKIPTDLKFEAKYIDKREHVRIIENTRVDTVNQKSKKFGFAIGPSVGIGIDINNIKQPVYFLGATLTYGWRF